MRTDENTQEHFHLNGTPEQLRSQLLLNQQTFDSNDWKKIEQSKSILKPKVRATVWVCEEPKRLLVDWQLPAE
jgi:hypothetical protein